MVMKKVIVILLTLLSFSGLSQVSNYSYQSTTTAYSANSSPSTIHSNSVDDALSSAINIGFNFKYNNITYTQFKASSNGFITFNTTNTLAQPTNNLNTSTDRVIVAVLWDDNQTGASGNVNYLVTGSSPNRVLTIEWLALRWNKSGFSAGTIDCQIKLFETTNIIQFIYNRGSYQSFGNSLSIGASIGLNGATSGDFLSLSDISASPTKSTSVETTTIGASPTNLLTKTAAQANTQIPNGTTYVFTPPPTITTSGTLGSFSSCSGSVSSEQSFSVLGYGLTANISVTAPTGFEVSKTSGSGFASSVSLSQSGGVVSSTTIYVRLTSSATGSPSGNVSISSTNATTQNVSASGNVTTTVTPSVSVTSNDVDNSFCSGTSVTFTATPTNGGSSPSYQWKLNNSNVGSNSTTYSNSNLSNNDVVNCIMTANNTCQSSSTGTSNSITNNVISNVSVSVSISSTSSSICSGTNVTFTASPTNGGVSPSYQWKLNNSNVGSNSITYSNTGLSNNDVISCVMTSNASCVINSQATSNTITMVVYSNSIGGNVTSDQTINSGSTPSNVTLSSNVGSVLKWQSSSTTSFTTYTDIANTSTTLTGVSMGVLNNTKYYRAVVQNGNCSSTNSNYVTITVTNTLPIELLYFKGIYTISGNELSWETLSETNNDYFTIYRSNNPTNWNSITTINGAGNSSDIINYTYIDNNYSEGINYYMLRQTDYDGNYKDSDVIFVNNRVINVSVLKVLNLLGQDIDIKTPGIKILYYSDGSIIKIY